jgi:phage repressor protein C with HTH and peptisase S24 domain
VRTLHVGQVPDFELVRRVKLRLRAGVEGFETEADMSAGTPLSLPLSDFQHLSARHADLLALQVRDRGLEPLIFEDDWIVIDTSDTARRDRELYAVNWDGEACITQLQRRGGQWYLSFINPDFKPLNTRSGWLSIVGRVVYQPGRMLVGRL